MGWWSSVFGSGSSADPLDKLDPKLREFLQKESPVKYAPKPPSPPPSPAPEAAPTSEAKAADAEPGAPQVPAASLFPDGRYAHLWKSYRPLSQIHADSATDHDKLADVIDGFKSRKAAIGRAAMENCALEQEEWANCMKHGSWEDRMQMCKHQVRRFERCYGMQSKFLRALGFGSVVGRPSDVDDDIQMHADALFQRMLRHEAAVEQAKQDGTPIPVFEVTLPKSRTSAATPPQELAEQWRQDLAKLPEDERAVEEAALRADYEAKSRVATRMQDLRQAQKEERTARMDTGKGTLLDSITAFLGR